MLCLELGNGGQKMHSECLKTGKIFFFSQTTLKRKNIVVNLLFIYLFVSFNGKLQLTVLRFLSAID